jgi:hypothetical protein
MLYASGMGPRSESPETTPKPEVDTGPSLLAQSRRSLMRHWYTAARDPDYPNPSRQEAHHAYFLEFFNAVSAKIHERAEPGMQCIRFSIFVNTFAELLAEEQVARLKEEDLVYSASISPSALQRLPNNGSWRNGPIHRLGQWCDTPFTASAVGEHLSETVVEELEAIAPDGYEEEPESVLISLTTASATAYGTAQIMIADSLATELELLLQVVDETR